MNKTTENSSTKEGIKSPRNLEIVITIVVKNECGRRDLNPSFKLGKLK